MIAVIVAATAAAAAIFVGSRVMGSNGAAVYREEPYDPPRSVQVIGTSNRIRAGRHFKGIADMQSFFDAHGRVWELAAKAARARRSE